MEELIGNDGAKSTLFSAIRNNRCAGCYLIEGAEGTGKLTLARMAAATIACEHREAEGRACFSCHSCRSIMNGNHIDVIELRPEENGKAITVDAVRALLKNTHNTPTEADWHIFIIENCDCMNKQAQNALLKSIEEPYEKTVFFLLTVDKTKLLPTVKSRSVMLRTEPLSKELLVSILKKEQFPLQRIEEAAILSGGSLGKARDLLQDNELPRLRNKVLSYFSAIMNGASFTRLCQVISPDYCTRKEFSALLPFIKEALRDLICVASGRNDSVHFFTDRSMLFDLASIINLPNAVLLFDSVENMMLSIEQNANVFTSVSALHLAAQNLTKPV